MRVRNIFLLSLIFGLSNVPGNAALAATSCNQAAPDPITYIEMPGHPYKAIAANDGCTLLVSISAANDHEKSGIAILRRDRGSVSLSHVVPIEASDMKFTHNGRFLIATNGRGVVILDARRLLSGRGDPTVGYIEDQIGIPSDTARYMGPQRTANTHNAGSVEVEITRDDRYLFVADEWTQAITVIDLRKGIIPDAVIGRIPLAVLPGSGTFSPDGRYLYAFSQIGLQSYNWPVECKAQPPDPTKTEPVNPQGAIFIIDVGRATKDPTNSIVGKVPAGCSPARLITSPDGRKVFVSARNSDAILAFDAFRLLTNPDHALIGSVPVGIAPVGLTTIQNGRYLVVTNSNRFFGTDGDKQTLTVIEIAKIAQGAAAIGGRIEAGAFPREVHLTSDQRTMLVANFTSRTLELVDLARVALGNRT
jgi:hypothetical protein